MAVFYGQFKVDSFKRQMKENRKIEELILMFATHATGVLKKDQSLSGDGWKIELNNHIAQFVKLLRESLRSLSHVSPELVSRLDMYAAKLSAPVGSGQDAGPGSESGYDSSSTKGDGDYVNVGKTGLSQTIHDMPLVMIVANLFQVRHDLLQKEIDKMKAYCTERVRDFLFFSIALKLPANFVSNPEGRTSGPQGKSQCWCMACSGLNALGCRHA